MDLIIVVLICLAAGIFLFRQMWRKMRAKSECDCCSRKTEGCSCSAGPAGISQYQGGDNHGQKNAETDEPR